MLGLIIVINFGVKIVETRELSFVGFKFVNICSTTSLKSSWPYFYVCLCGFLWRVKEILLYVMYCLYRAVSISCLLIHSVQLSGNLKLSQVKEHKTGEKSIEKYSMEIRHFSWKNTSMCEYIYIQEINLLSTRASLISFCKTKKKMKIRYHFMKHHLSTFYQIEFQFIYIFYILFMSNTVK